MRAKQTALFVAFAALVASSALAQQTTSDTLLVRMQALKARYPGQVTIATLARRPAYFVKTTNLDATQTERFRTDLLKALGTNTIRAWNTTDWLQCGTGVGTNRKLSSQNQGKHFALYNTFRDYTWALPSSEETCVLLKVSNNQLSNSRGKGFDQYINAIRSDFYGALGETDYNGDYDGPPFVTDNPSGKHNCTSWFTNWFKKFVGGGMQYGADPGSWCEDTALSSARPVRGLLVFNHPHTPQDGAQLPSNFQLYWGDVH